jgi:hypothetical protein
MKRSTTVVGISLWLFCASASAQVTLETLRITAPDPPIAENWVAGIHGYANVSDLPNFRTEWKRDGTDIRMDVLHDFIAAGAPPQMIPYTEEAVLGNLPAGTYDLTGRLFSLHRQIPDESPFPDPWTFPDSHDGFVYSLTMAFTVVPEPSSLVLAMVGAVLILRRRDDKRG